MTSTKPIVRRLLGGGVLCAVFGALTVGTAAPASASPLVWGNAQAWVSDGDAVSGYSTAISHGDAHEEEADAEEISGPLAEYAEISGSSYALVDDEGAHAVSAVDSAVFRLEVEDLVDLGMIDVPEPEKGGEGGRNGTEEEDEADEPSTLEDQAAPDEDDEPAEETEHWTEADEPEAVPSPEPPPRPEEDAGGEGTDEGEGDPQDQESPESEESPEVGATESPIRGDARLMPLDTAAASDTGGTGGVEFTVADVRATVRAEYGGRTRTDFEHGEITAFGEPVRELEQGGEGTTVTDVLEVPDTEGGPGEEIPVSVHFVVNESNFEDEDPEWEGEGARSWLTVWVQVGEPGEENGFAVELADSWALGSTHVSESGPSPSEGEDGETAAEEAPVSRLPTTGGGSLAALVTAACVAVGGGCAATYLARGRTTAMDDRIED
ncbi:hypothetical protein [Nocardiopsis xinjiangensis]|uniref:hypothetical protein n=1 Tax=Nocardiopsis xinjiangensis TaxID=124285 RepID=UPI000B496A41|nr:hypothetical protein [Nocardiopsis xinjiangensis]